VLFEAVIYDLPGRDCAALASNGELPATAAGLTEYETQYIDPIAALLGSSSYGNLRIVTVVEPDSLPNVVTNQSKPACATATPYYESGIEYALNKLHAIGNLYTYLDIGHSAWLGWPSNMTPAAAEYAKVARATTAGFASVDGFVSDTANYTPTDEPFLPDSSLTVGGQPLKSANFYQWNPYFDEHTYDEAMHSAFVSAGFPGTVGMLIDTSRNGWGGSGRPTALNSSPTDVNTYVTDNKTDQRAFRGDWCNVNGAGLGYRPTVQPYGASDPIQAYVWIKPPGESDGDYPTSSHAHGDPHCDPSGTQTDGSGNTYPTDAIPGYDVPAGQWFAYQFQMLVKNAYPAVDASGSGSGGGSGGGSGAGCTAAYTVSNSWGTGFTATVTVSASSSAAVSGWKVNWSWGGNQTVSNSWNATVTQSGSAVTAVNSSYNGALAAGASTSFGFQASYSGSNATPTLTCTAS
jgi:cellulose 1,4-beta-cellobiosidase